MFYHRRASAGVEEKVEITVYLKNDPDPSTEEVSTMQAEIMTWPEVKCCTYVTKEQALARMKEEYADSPEIFDTLIATDARLV